MKYSDYKMKKVKVLVTYILYAIVVGGIALIVSGVFPSNYITVDWVKCLLGVALIGAVRYTCSWFFHTDKDDTKQ